MPKCFRGKWFITPHAVHRYIERVRPYLGYDDALLVLAETSNWARRIRELEAGVFLWRGPRPDRLRCLVSENTCHERPLPQLLTVYTGKDPGWEYMLKHYYEEDCRSAKQTWQN